MSIDQEQRSGRATFVQQGIWLNELRTEMHDAYHLPFTISFHGELDTASIVTATAAVLERHSVLVQAFGEHDGVAHVVPAAHAPQIAQADLSGLPSGRREPELQDQMRCNIQRPFDLRKGPLVRMTLYCLGQSRHVLLVVAHHLIFDGPSMEIFARDLLGLYELTVSGRDPVLPQLRHAAEEYAATQERLVGAILPDAQRFWHARWQEPRSMALPGVTGSIRPVDAGEQVDVRIDGDLRVRLLDVCHDLDISEFDFLLASLHCLLYRYGNDLPVATIALGLRPAEYNDNIGSFAQELPFATSVPQGMTFSEFVAGLHDDLRELYKYRMVPLNRAMPGVHPSAQHTAVSLSYRRVEQNIRLPRLEVHASRMHNSWVRGALSVLAYSRDSALDFIIGYPSQALTREAAQRIAGHWRRVIEQVTANPDAIIDNLSVLDADEREPDITGLGELPGRDCARSAGTESGLATDGDTEKVRDIWREILKIRDIGVRDDLFDFGVDSLAVNRISLAIYREFDVDIPLEVFYDYPTIVDIANVIARARQEG